MSNREPEIPASKHEIKKDISHELRLRPERTGVVQVSKHVVIGAVSVSALIVAGLIAYALKEREKEQTSAREETIEHHNIAEAVSGLPKSYERLDVPKLGPPLPGDLGRPMLNAGVTPNDPTATKLDQEAQRQAQETEAARVSRLFTLSAVRQQPQTQTANVNGPIKDADQKHQQQFAPDETFAQSGQDRKLAFVKASTDRRVTSPDRLMEPVSAYILQGGTIIPGALITGIRSDLPGEITAQVTEAVYDSPTGQHLLIPQGSKLIGAYDSQVAFGQSRVLLVWTRLILPNGKSIVMERQAGSDAAGYSGLQDGVDRHWGTLIGAAALTTLLSVGMEAGLGNNQTALFQSLASGASMGFNQIGRQLIGRNLNIQPTLTIRPGFPVRVIVNRDLILEPYQS